MAAYLTGERTHFTIEKVVLGTPFQQKVWHALEEIPFGHTATYQDIAISMGQPRAVRAVANANRANLFALLIPGIV